MNGQNHCALVDSGCVVSVDVRSMRRVGDLRLDSRVQYNESRDTPSRKGSTEASIAAEK